MKELTNIKELFDSFQEYIEAENMVFKTLEDNMKSGTIDSQIVLVTG